MRRLTRRCDIIDIQIRRLPARFQGSLYDCAGKGAAIAALEPTATAPR